MTDFESLYTSIRRWMEKRGIALREQDLGADRAGQFDGLSATMSPRFSLEGRVYYLVHALGSIVLWSQNKQDIQEVFDELRAAKETKENQARLNRAIERYREPLKPSLPSLRCGYSNIWDIQKRLKVIPTSCAPIWIR